MSTERNAIFAAIADAETSNSGESRRYFDHAGRLRASLEDLTLVESKNPATMGETKVAAKFKIIGDFDGYENDETVSRVLRIQQSGWSGKYARRELKQMLAAIAGIPAEDVTQDVVAAAFTSLDEIRGTVVNVNVVDKDGKDGKTYQNVYWNHAG